MQHLLSIENFGTHFNVRGSADGQAKLNLWIHLQCLERDPKTK